ncbi:MAG: tol-pal system protein YbgF [Deltaproteobacteria bacterium]|nr:tol-pal system protein YbgF [Deltaproteobacteria bacterium]
MMVRAPHMRPAPGVLALLVLVLALGLSWGCSWFGGGVSSDDFDALGGRVDRLEQAVFRGPPGAAAQTGPVPGGAQYPPGGAIAPLDPAFASAFGPGTGQKDPSGPKPSASERSRYDRAQSLLKGKRYSQAAVAFSEMLRDFPGGALAPNARYWLGECRYAAGDYPGAFLEFRQGFGDYPGSNKAPDFLLKMSYCQSLLGDGPGAMETLRRLLASFPDSDPARLVKSGRGRFAGI